MSRAKPWDALAALALRGGWDARVTHARGPDGKGEEWCSVALRARSPQGRRVIGLWRGREPGAMKFTSAMTWIERGYLRQEYPRPHANGFFAVLSAAGLREVLREG